MTASTESAGNEPYSQARLASAFDRVRDSRDWKAPIQAEIWAEDRPLVAAAVVCFTASEPSFSVVQGKPGRLEVSAPGYGSRPPESRP